MKVVVGLGNPGRKYVRTRHNVGFEVLAELAGRHLSKVRPTIQFDAECVDFLLGGEKILLVAPQSFMNRSGGPVGRIVEYYQVPLEELIVVCDDMNLDCGRLRLRPGGSAGGQKGLADMIRRLDSEAIPRLRIGIGRPPGRVNSSSWVLSRFEKADREVIDHVIVLAADALEVWINEGLDSAMNRFNSIGKPQE